MHEVNNKNENYIILFRGEFNNLALVYMQNGILGEVKWFV